MVYRVKWKNGQPFIEHGEIIITGTKKQSRRIMWPSNTKMEAFSSGHDSIKKAVEADIFRIASLFGEFGFGYRKNVHASAWNIANCIIELMRLCRKMEKHNLIKW